MKPKKNRVFCFDCGRSKMVFDSEERANRFLLFNRETMLKNNGHAPVRAYYCHFCCGWHLTSSMENKYFLETKGSRISKHIDLLFKLEHVLKELEQEEKSLEHREQLQCEFEANARLAKEIPGINLACYNRIIRNYLKFISVHDRISKSSNPINIINKKLKKIHNQISCQNITLANVLIKETFRTLISYELLTDIQINEDYVVSVKQELSDLIVQTETLLRQNMDEEFIRRIDKNLAHIDKLINLGKLQDAHILIKETFLQLEKINVREEQLIKKYEVPERLNVLTKRICSKEHESIISTFREAIDKNFTQINEQFTICQIKKNTAYVKNIIHLIDDAENKGMNFKELQQYRKRAMQVIDKLTLLAKNG